MNPHIYHIGQPFDPQIQQWPEGAMYVYQTGIHQVLLMFKGIQPFEYDAFLYGLTRFGLYVEEDVIMLLFKSDGRNGSNGIEWHDIPYSWHLIPEEARTIPQAPETIPINLGVLMHLFFIDAQSGVLVAARELNVSHDFTKKLNRAIREQITRPFNEVRYLQHVDQIRQKFPTPQAVADQAEAKCIGGILEV